MKIVLLGYMGSGKSIVANKLAEQSSRSFIDLDAYIVKEEGMAIADIFEKRGEIYFRKKEAQYLSELLEAGGDSIIAVGGGTPCYGSNMELIKTKSVSVYLKTSVKTLYDRLVPESSERPLIAGIPCKKLPEFIAKHLFDRTPFYIQAQHIITTDDKTIDDIAKEVMQLF